jgi:branched-chain amino acid transport system permease protein
VLQSLLVGLIPGSAYALLGVSIVLSYRMVGVLNFAQAVIGVFGTYVGLSLAAAGMGQPYAAISGIIAGIGTSLLAGVVMVGWFSEARVQTRSSVTIALMLLLLAVGFRIFGDTPRAVPQLFPATHFEIGGVHFSLTTIACVVGAIGIGIAVNSILEWTRIGVLLRALSERPTTAELLGVRVRLLALGVWAAAGGVATLAITLIAPNRPSNFLVLSLLLLPSLAAALFGLFQSISAAILGGMVLGLLEGFATYFDTLAPYRQALPFAVILIVLLWSQRAEVWDATK